MKYLAEMTDHQTLVLYSGHPLGLFPSSPAAPRVVVTNGMVIPSHSTPEDYEKMNALGVTQYGQMTAGSFMYIGPQGIVHGTTITVLNAGRMMLKGAGAGSAIEVSGGSDSKVSGGSGGTGSAFEGSVGSEDAGWEALAGKVFVTSGLGGMSGAQPRATVIAGGICVVAEVNPLAVEKRHSQGWVDEVFTDLASLVGRMEIARRKKEAVSLAYIGNIVDLWEYLVEHDIPVELGSDQT